MYRKSYTNLAVELRPNAKMKTKSLNVYAREQKQCPGFPLRCPKLGNLYFLLVMVVNKPFHKFSAI